MHSSGASASLATSAALQLAAPSSPLPTCAASARVPGLLVDCTRPPPMHSRRVRGRARSQVLLTFLRTLLDVSEPAMWAGIWMVGVLRGSAGPLIFASSSTLLNDYITERAGFYNGLANSFGALARTISPTATGSLYAAVTAHATGARTPRWAPVHSPSPIHSYIAHTAPHPFTDAHAAIEAPLDCRHPCGILPRSFTPPPPAHSQLGAARLPPPLLHPRDDAVAHSLSRRAHRPPQYAAAGRREARQPQQAAALLVAPLESAARLATLMCRRARARAARLMGCSAESEHHQCNFQCELRQPRSRGDMRSRQLVAC